MLDYSQIILDHHNFKTMEKKVSERYGYIISCYNIQPNSAVRLNTNLAARCYGSDTHRYYYARVDVMSWIFSPR